MEETFHYLLMANQAAFRREVFQRLKGSGLTSGQPKILDYLGNHDGASQKEIAKGCHIEPASLTTVLHGMEEKGFIQRRSLHGDRRTSHIFMTDKGRGLQQQVAEAFALMEERAFAGIPEDERQNFLKTFAKLYDNVMARKEEGRAER